MEVSVSVTTGSDAYVLKIEGLFTQGWRPGRTSDESVNGIFEMGISDWMNGLQYHLIDNMSDTEFRLDRCTNSKCRTIQYARCRIPNDPAAAKAKK